MANPADQPSPAPRALPWVKPPSFLRRLRGWVILLCLYSGCVLLLTTCLCAWVVMLAPYRFSPEACQAFQQADAHWPADHGWVWVNTSSGIYHRPGTRWYGNTESGKYLPEWAALLEGYRVAANGQ